jgi:hypothetical protein
MQSQTQTQGRQQAVKGGARGLQQEGEPRGDADGGSPKDRNERVRRRQEEEQRRQRGMAAADLGRSDFVTLG